MHLIELQAHKFLVTNPEKRGYPGSGFESQYYVYYYITVVHLTPLLILIIPIAPIAVFLL